MGLLYWQTAASREWQEFSLTSFSETFEEDAECVLNKLADGAKARTVSAEGQSCHLNGSRQVGGMTCEDVCKSLQGQIQGNLTSPALEKEQASAAVQGGD